MQQHAAVFINCATQMGFNECCSKDILQNLPASRVDVRQRWHPIEP